MVSVTAHVFEMPLNWQSKIQGWNLYTGASLHSISVFVDYSLDDFLLWLELCY